MKWKWHPKFSEDSRFPSEIQWYKNTRSGLRFWSVQYSTKRSLHPPTIRISEGGIYFCDITNTGKQLCSPNEPFVVVLEKGFFKNEISPFGVDFETCNFVDLFMPKYTHYTLTKIQKVKKHNRTPLNILSEVFGACRLWDDGFVNSAPSCAVSLHATNVSTGEVHIL